MAAYVIVQGEVLDEDKYLEYKELTPKTVSDHDGRFIVRGGQKEDLEGRWDTSRVVVLEFPSMDHARRWYASEEYQAAKRLREGAANLTFTLIEGVPGGSG